jgi:hypothetical protein
MMMQMRSVSLLVFFGFTVLHPIKVRAEDWETSALRLSGESDQVARSSVQKLKKIPDLETKLSRALSENSTRTFLALDVISTLKLKKLLPVIIDHSQKDESGFFYLALNTFIDSKNLQDMSKLYEERLSEAKTSPPAKMVILDTLGRIQVKISPSQIQKILEDSDNPEMRSAALYYVRTWVRKKDRDYENVFRKCLKKNNKTINAFSAQLQSLQNEFNSHE